MRKTSILTTLLVGLLTTTAQASEHSAALDLFKKGQFEAAQSAFKKLVAADAKNAEAWSYLGVLALRQDDYKQAVEFGEKAVKLAPGTSAFHQRLGDAYGRTAIKVSMLTKMSWAGKCRDAYLKAIELDPKNVDARFSILGFYRQAPGFMGGGLDKAYKEAEDIKKLDPLRGLQAYEVIYLDEKKNNEAFALWDETLKADPNSYIGNYRIGRIAAVSGDQLDRGLAALERCLSQTPAADMAGHDVVQIRRGQILEKKGDKAGARVAYDTALKLNPENGMAKEARAKLK
jgi:tetratricopeptide (TPR) repeat protein